MRLSNCHNFHDFRKLARRRLPGPIFNYIDGAADDEVTHRRNTASFDRCGLVPNVLRGVESVDMSVTVMGQKLPTPFYCSPTALQRLFHDDGERTVAAAASKFGIGRAVNVKPVLVPVPFAAWHALAWAAEVMPGVPVTRNQVELMEIYTVASAGVPGFADLGISPRAMEDVLQSILRRA